MASPLSRDRRCHFFGPIGKVSGSRSGGLSGRVTVTTRYGTGTMPISQPGAGQLALGYSCSESSLSTTLDFPGMSPMVTHYTKVPEIE